MLNWIGKTFFPIPHENNVSRYWLGGYWGNAIEWQNRGQSVVGWKPIKPKVHDILLAAHYHPGMIGVFRFTNVRYCGDPHDMFFGDVEFVRNDPPTEEMTTGHRIERYVR